MKKIIIGLSLSVVSTLTFAASTAVCTTGTGSAVDATTGLTGSTAFVQTGFTPKCSANTSVAFAQSPNTAAVGAISTKGNQVFGGHTNGGAVAKLTTNGDCTTCTETNATGAADTMLTDSSS